MSSEHYDTISIGSGEAGKYVCWNRSSIGKKTAVIEHKWLGGSCPNIACLPSKNILYSAELFRHSQKYAATGLLKASLSGVDMNLVRERKREMVTGLIEMHEGVFEATGAELISGHARLVDKNTVEVDLKDGGRRTLTADNIIICTGSRAKIDSTIPGLAVAKPLTHIELLELDIVPKHLIILGGGYSGLEFAQAFRRFGAEVTVIERNPTILKNEDEDTSSALVEILKSEGITFRTSTLISNVSGTSGGSVHLSGTQNGSPFEVSGSHLLVASGRLPNTSDTGLETVGIELTSSGHVKVNALLQTNIPHIFAVGDCANSPHFTHMGFDDFRIVKEFLAAKEEGKTSARSTAKRQVPYTLYTSPELAHVGLHEHEALAAGIRYRLAKLPMAAFLRTRTMDASGAGFAKALVSAEDDTILGFTVLGPRAGEMLPVVQLAMSAGLPYTQLAGLIITHPTMSEGLVSLFGAVPARKL